MQKTKGCFSTFSCFLYLFRLGDFQNFLWHRRVGWSFVSCILVTDVPSIVFSSMSFRFVNSPRHMQPFPCLTVPHAQSSGRHQSHDSFVTVACVHDCTSFLLFRHLRSLHLSFAAVFTRSCCLEVRRSGCSCFAMPAGPQVKTISRHLAAVGSSNTVKKNKRQWEGPSLTYVPMRLMVRQSVISLGMTRCAC